MRNVPQLFPRFGSCQFRHGAWKTAAILLLSMHWLAKCCSTYNFLVTDYLSR